MEGNRDESNRCIRLAEKCLKLGDTEQALKYLKKAERLFSSMRARGERNDLECEECVMLISCLLVPGNRLIPTRCWQRALISAA